MSATLICRLYLDQESYDGGRGNVKASESDGDASLVPQGANQVAPTKLGLYVSWTRGNQETAIMSAAEQELKAPPVHSATRQNASP